MCLFFARAVTLKLIYKQKGALVLTHKRTKQMQCARVWGSLQDEWQTKYAGMTFGDK